MSEQDNSGQAPAKTQEKSEFSNFKAEMDRKLNNMSNEWRQSTEGLLSEIGKLSQSLPKPQATQVSNEDLKDLVWTDPAAYAQKLEEQVEKRVNAILGKRENEYIAQQAHQTALAKMYTEFPELGIKDSPLTTRAVEIFQGFSKEDQADPKSYKLAIQEAAMELEIKPKSKRKSSNNDDFVMSGEGGSGNRSTSSDSKLPKKILDIAEAFGLDTSNEKVKARLTKNTKRNWLKYE